MTRKSMIDRWTIDDELLDEVAAKRVAEKPPTRHRAIDQRKFNPDQPRIPGGHEGGGRWGGGVGDVLHLLGRIRLGDDEHLVDSGHLAPDGSSGSDPFADMLFAVVDTPDGRRTRLGVIPFHDVTKWTAGNKGSTVDLSAEQLGHLGDQLADADRLGKAAAARADKQWAAGKTPDLTEPVAQGRITTEWGTLVFHTFLTDDDPTQWRTSIEIQRSDVSEAETVTSQLDPKDLRKLLKLLADMQS